MAAKENVLFKLFVNDHYLRIVAGARAHLEFARGKLVVEDQQACQVYWQRFITQFNVGSVFIMMSSNAFTKKQTLRSVFSICM